MAYIKKEWKIKDFQKGDKEFIAGLNHLEEGVAEGGGSGPSQYLKDAIKEGSKLIITKNDGTLVEYNGGEPEAFLKDAAINAEKLVITKKDGSNVEFDISGKANQTDLDLEKDARVNADAELQEHIDTKQGKLTAGTNITIDENNVISATGGGSGNVDSITIGGEKLLPDNKDIKIVLGNSLAYSDQEPGLAYKNLHVNFKSTHGLEIDGTNGLKVKINKTAGTLALDAAGLRVAEGKFVEVPNEPVEGQGVNVPYYFDVNYGPDKATVNDYTIDLLDKTRSPRQFSLDINGASSTTAGLMSAASFNKVEQFGNIIPEQASADNKLADKNFVNSTVQTLTAVFRGNFATKAALDAYAGEKKLNDYAVVQADETHENQSWRYKYNGSIWVAEYKLNDTAFTAAQLAAINSGINSDKVGLYDTHINNSDVHVTANQKLVWDAKQNAISDLDDIRTKANNAVQPAAISDMATKYWVEQQRYLKEHQDISGKANLPDKLPEELRVPGVDYPWFMINLNPKSIDADGNLILDHSGYNFNTQQYYTWTDKSIPMAASTTNGGLMTAADKVKLNAAITEHQSLADYAKTTEVDEKDNAVKTWAEGTFIKEHQSLDNYYTKSEVDAKDTNKVDKPIEPVAGQGVNVPYYFDVNYAADKVTVKDYTIDLLDKSKAPQQFSIDINCANQSNAGLLSAADKKNIDEMLPAYPTDTEAEYVLSIKYVDGAWVKYWKETVNKSDIVDKGTVDYMVLKQ